MFAQTAHAQYRVSVLFMTHRNLFFTIETSTFGLSGVSADILKVAVQTTFQGHCGYFSSAAFTLGLSMPFDFTIRLFGLIFIE